MKKTVHFFNHCSNRIYIVLFIFLAFNAAGPKVICGQEFATLTLTGLHQGTGTFTNAVLPDFTWLVEGTLTGEVQILDSETFDDGNVFENTFGQADNADNLRIQIIPNGSGTSGQPITSHATLTLDFDQSTPLFGWGFCLVDIDVENALISALDQNNNEVSHEEINTWMVELFDANLYEDGINFPKWDPESSAVLGSDTPESYVTYNNLVIGGMPSCEAPAVFFMPEIHLNALIIEFESLQENYNTSYHFYMASLTATGVGEADDIDFNIFPNPVTAWFKVQGSKFKIGSATLELLDLSGRKLVKKQIPMGNEYFEVDVTNLKSGLYFCRITMNNTTYTKKISIGSNP